MPRRTWLASTSAFEQQRDMGNDGLGMAHTDATLAGDSLALAVDHFDGRSARAHRIKLKLDGDQLKLLSLDDGALIQQIDAHQVQWPERTRHGARVAHLPDGGSLHALDSAGWDAWRVASGHHQASWIVRAQQSWRGTVIALLLLIATITATYQWGLPMAAGMALSVTPRTLDQRIGDMVFESANAHWFQPSQLDATTQQRLQIAFARAVQQTSRHSSLQETIPFKVVFLRSKIGPNALAFPNGTIVITDELVTLLDARQEVLMGVFAHEWGHVQHRHSMRLLIQASAVGALASVLVGDFSHLLATAPTLLGHMAYSRDFEREADETALQVLQDNGIAPLVMLTLFEQLGKNRRARGEDDAQGLGFAFSSHPSDAERVARFSRP